MFFVHSIVCWLPTVSVFALLVSSCIVAGCDHHTPDSVGASHRTQNGRLVDVSAESGLGFQHDSGIDGSYFLPQTMGAGGALFDYDQDGDLDIYLITGGGESPANRLFRQDAPFQFTDVSLESGLNDTGYGMGAALGDIDNDGDLDIFVSNFGADTLFRNEGAGRFLNVTVLSGLDSADWSTSATFLDYDRDGNLDLFIATYVVVDRSRICTDARGTREFCPPKVFPGVPDRLYRNDGGGSFRDVSADSGIAAVTSKGLGVAVADFDDDGWPDIFVANDGEKNDLWLNLKDGRFEERAIVMGAAYNLSGKPEASMGVALGDLNRDLTLDLFITHLSEETNTLYARLPDGSLQDNTAISGLAAASLPYTGFGTGLTDLNLDGYADLLVLNGRVSKREANTQTADFSGTGPLADYRHRYPEPNRIFHGNADRRFNDACDLYGAFCAMNEVSRGLMIGDIDNDGDEDIVVGNSNGPARLYRNDTSDDGHWLKVRAFDPSLGRDAIGALVIVRAGGEAWIRPVTHTYGYLVNGEAQTHFGLGQHEEIESIQIRWQDGSLEYFPGSKANRTLRVLRGNGVPTL